MSTQRTKSRPKKQSVGVVAVAWTERFLSELLSTAKSLADNRGDELTVLVPTDAGERPPWFAVPEHLDRSRITVTYLEGGSHEQQLVDWLRRHRPALLGFAFDPEDDDDRHVLNRDLDAALLRVKCPVTLFNPGKGLRRPEGRVPKVLIPWSDEANSAFALKTALEMNPVSELTVVATGPAPLDDADRVAREEEFARALGEIGENPRVTPKLILGDDAVDRLLDEASDYDRILLGASRGHTLTRAMLGERVAIGLNEVGKRVIELNTVPYAVVREYQGRIGSSISLAISRGESLLPAVTRAERIEIYKEVRRAARPRIDFFMMIGLSAAIASLGLLLNSPAVIIGAMLIAPLMAAIIGMGLAMVQGDVRFLLTSAGATARGALTAIGVGALMGVTNFEGTYTQEMLGRTGPAILDLGVATLSGAAAAYALCRKDVSASLPGVAIAVALVPPLATVGLFLSLGSWAYAWGAFLLFMTNLAAIAFSSGIIFTLVGFRPPKILDDDGRRLRSFKRAFITTGFLTFLIFTTLASRSISNLSEGLHQRRVQSVVADYFSHELRGQAHLLDLDILENDRKELHLVLTVATVREINDANYAPLAKKLTKLRGTPVRIALFSAPLISEIYDAAK